MPLKKLEKRWDIFLRRENDKNVPFKIIWHEMRKQSANFRKLL